MRKGIDSWNVRKGIGPWIKHLRFPSLSFSWPIYKESQDKIDISLGIKWICKYYNLHTGHHFCYSCIEYVISRHHILREATKKANGRAIKALPPPSSLMAQLFFCLNPKRILTIFSIPPIFGLNSYIFWQIFLQPS